MAAELARRSGRPVRLVYSPRRGDDRLGPPRPDRPDLPHRRRRRRPAARHRELGRGRRGPARLGVPGAEPGRDALRVRERALDGAAGEAQPRLLERVPRARRDGGHVRLRAGDRRARRDARDRPARDPAAKRRRPRAVERQPLHVQAPRDLPAPRGRARRLDGARRAALAGPHPPRDGHGEPDLVGRRRPAGARRRCVWAERPADARVRLPGHRHRHDDRLGGDRRRVARRARRLRAGAGGRHRPVGLRPDVGRLDDARVGRPGGALGRPRRAHAAARARLGPVRDRRVRPRRSPTAP